MQRKANLLQLYSECTYSILHLVWPVTPSGAQNRPQLQTDCLPLSAAYIIFFSFDKVVSDS